MSFQAANNLVILTLDHSDKTTDSGLVIPAKVRPIPNEGTVVSVGPKVDTVEVGCVVVFEHSAAYGIEIEGAHYVTVPVTGVLAIIAE